MKMLVTWLMPMKTSFKNWWLTLISYYLLKLSELKVIHSNREILKSTALWERLFSKFGRTKINVGKDIYNKVGGKMHKLTSKLQRRREDFQKKSKQNISKLKDLSKTLKLQSVGLSKNLSVVQTNAIEDIKLLNCDLKSLTQTFGKLNSNLTES